MTKPKRILITAIMALAVFGALLGAAYYSEAMKTATLTVLSIIGYIALTGAFYWLLGDSKQTEQRKYVAEWDNRVTTLERLEPAKAYDYAADEAETTRDIGITVEDILAEMETEK